MKLEISVIIPVYNAASFVRKAVESALAQPETAEILLIEDGSPDNSLEECNRLDAEYEKVRFFTHPDNANLGAGPTRNVGIERAQFDYIAFLDSDDYYLPDRFRAERKIFQDGSDIDGVYGAAGSHYYSKEGRKRYDDHGYSEIITIPEEIAPDELFEVLMGVARVSGYFILNALTVRRRVFDQTDVFFSDQRLHQDTEFILKLAAVAKLVAGSIDDPVVNIGIHDQNRIVAKSNNWGTEEILYSRLVEWAKNANLNGRVRSAFLSHYRLARIRSSKRPVALLKTIAACAVDPFFVRNRVFLIGAADHILNGRLVRAYSQIKQRILKTAK